MIKIGDMIGGRYRIVRQIGEGGMASVWLAHDGTLLRNVAIKFVWQRDPRRHKEMVGAFLREARIAASVVHRNVVQVLDFGLLEDSTPYMVMEALEGETLGDQFNEGAQFTLTEVDQIARRSLEGLIAVHETGIVHRDLKPENIFLLKERDGYFPKLLDFGISRSLDNTGGRKSAVTTRDGRIVGTPEYMSPEQAAGTAAVEQRTDIYSMGVILYETIAGDVPYKSDHIGALILQITSGEARPIVELVPEAGQRVSDVIQKAMQPNPAERFRDAGEMFEAWCRAIDGHRVGQASILPARSTDRRKRTGLTTLGADDEVSKLPPRQSITPAKVEAAGGVLQSPVPERESHTVVIQQRVLPPAVMWGGAALLIVAIAAVIWAMRAPASHPPGKQFIVVQGNQNAQEVLAPPPPAAVPAAGTTDPTATLEPKLEKSEPEKPEPSGRKATRAAPRKRPTKKPSAKVSVARAFAKQKGALTRCFEAHTNAEEAQLAVRLTIHTDGTVSKATISPAAYGPMQIGRCIQSAVLGMRFAPQTEPSTFRVPLTARRGS